MTPTAHTTEFDLLLDDVCASPEDWGLRRILADWCEDNNLHDEAACLRWAATENKRPWDGRAKTWPWPYSWCISADPHSVTKSALPDKLFFHVAGYAKYTGDAKWYDTPRAAESALLAAWKVATAEGWKPGVKDVNPK